MISASEESFVFCAWRHVQLCKGRRVEFPFLEEILERSGRKIRSSFP